MFSQPNLTNRYFVSKCMCSLFLSLIMFSSAFGGEIKNGFRDLVWGATRSESFKVINRYEGSVPNIRKGSPVCIRESDDLSLTGFKLRSIQYYFDPSEYGLRRVELNLASASTEPGNKANYFRLLLALNPVFGKDRIVEYDVKLGNNIQRTSWSNGVTHVMLVYYGDFADSGSGPALLIMDKKYAAAVAKAINNEQVQSIRDDL